MYRLLFLILFFLPIISSGQSVLPLRADTIRMEKLGGSAELHLRNATRDTLGVLTNIGNGRTRFIRARIVGDTLFVGRDTLIIATDPTIQEVINNGNLISDANDSIVVTENNTFGLYGRNNTVLNIQSTGNSTSFGHLRLDNDGFLLRQRNLGTGLYKGIQGNSLSNTGISVFDQGDQTGLGYAANYRTNGIANLGDRWIPDWGAVKDSIAGAVSGSTPAVPATRVPYGSVSNTLTTEAAFTYNATTNTLNADSFRTKTAYHDTTIYANGTITPDGDTLYTVGDSFTEGSNATSIPDSAYVGYMSRFYGLPLLNYGLGGTGASYSVWKHLEQVNPGHSFFSSAMFGFNNIKQAGKNQKTFRKIVNAAKTIFVNQFAKVSAPGGSTGQGLTRHGAGWNAPWPANSVGGKSSAAAYTNVINDSAKYTFTDSTVFFTVMGGDGSGSLYSPSNIDVYIDGVLIETYSPNNQTDGNVDIGEPSLDGKLIPCTRIYTGLTYGPHTLKIVNAQSGFLMLDFVGTLLDPYEGKTLLLWNPSHGTATGFAAGSYTLGSNALMDSVKVKFDSLKAALPPNFPFFLAQTNTLLNTAIHIDADSVHPNNAGMRDWLFPTAVAALGSGTNARPRQLFYANNRLWIVKNDGIIAPIVTGDVIYKGGQYSADTLKIGTVNNSIVSIYSNGTNIANFGTGFYGLDMMEKKLRAGDADLATGQIQLRNTISPASGVIAGIGRVGGRVGFILNRDQFGPAPDDNIWSINISNAILNFQALSDDGATGASFMQVYRNTSSVAIDSMELFKKISYTGNFHASFGQFSLVDKKYVDSMVTTGSIAMTSYTPTITSVTNVASTTLKGARYRSDGAFVEVWVYVTIDPTSVGSTEIAVSLPVASELGADELFGSGSCGVAAQSGIVTTDATNNRATFFFSSSDTGAQDHVLIFTYPIVLP